jgi:hypothetical protein
MMEWLIERCITAEASIHVNDVSLSDVRARRDQSDLIGVQVSAAFERRDFAFRRANVGVDLDAA